MISSSWSSTTKNNLSLSSSLESMFPENTQQDSTCYRSDGSQESNSSFSSDIDHFVVANDQSPSSSLQPDRQKSDVVKCFASLKTLYVALKKWFGELRHFLQKVQKARCCLSRNNRHHRLSKYLKQEIDYSITTFIESIDGPCNQKTCRNEKYALVMSFLQMKNNLLKKL